VRKLTIISQVYPPDPAAVGQHLADVAEELVRRGWSVTVLTSARAYDNPAQRYPRQELRAGVKVRRFALSSFGKRSLFVRLIAQSIFMIQAVIAAWVRPRPDVILASTSPPFAGAGAAFVSWARNVPLVWWVMDINPDQLIATGRMRNTAIVVRIFDALNRFTIAQATRVIALDRFMAERLIRKQPCAEKVSVIPPWAPDGEVLSDAGSGAFRQRHGLVDRFVVMYSGNHALVHPIDTLLDAAERLAEDSRYVFVFIGGGAGKAAVEERITKRATNIISLPYQPLATLGDSLNAADMHVVSMGDAMVGIVHPCKIYGALQIGKPILMLGPAHSAAGELVTENRLGWVVPHGDVPKAVRAIREGAAFTSCDLLKLRQRARLSATPKNEMRNALNAVANTLANVPVKGADVKPRLKS
jgi:colanic acid biosynthesis glycosyl transferase WcaI